MVIITMITIMMIIIIAFLLFIYLFIFFCILFCYLFGTICLLQNGVPTKACIIYFSITRGSDSKIWKIYLSTMKQKNKKTNKYSDSLGMAHQLMTGETVSGIPIKKVFALIPQQIWLYSTVHHCDNFCLLIFILFSWWLCNHKSFLTVCLCQLMIFYHNSL